jgi:hypothetical protein
MRYWSRTEIPVGLEHESASTAKSKQGIDRINRINRIKGRNIKLNQSILSS